MIQPKYTDFISNFFKIRNKLTSPFITFYLRYFSGVIIGDRAKFSGLPIVLCRQGGKIIIGDNFHATSHSIDNPAGIAHRVILTAYGNNSVLHIGNDVGVSGVSINCWNKIIIEDNVIIGAGTVIWDTDFHPTDYLIRIKNPTEVNTAPIEIKKNTFIGARVIILKGVTIGENSVIAAGAVVNKNVPANSLVYGNPMIIKHK
jgi:acetyltransferase-like isoleucine patch superfamily enzyme